MKKFLLVFILGALIFSTLTITANVRQYILTPASYNVVADGVIVGDPDYPILNYNGTTYLSLRKAADVLNVSLEWNGELKQAELNTKMKVDSDGEYKILYFKNVKCDILDLVTDHHDKQVIIKDGQTYVIANLFSKYNEKAEDGAYYINLPDREPIMIVAPGRKATEHSYIDAVLTFVKPESLGLKIRLEGETLIVE
ncbi:UNVERIFIED_CONTAM: copper amine oxidase-like protein [Acetivibrio alkalicellulosi]